MIVQVSK